MIQPYRMFGLEHQVSFQHMLGLHTSDAGQLLQHFVVLMVGHLAKE